MIKIAKPAGAGDRTDVASTGTWRKLAIAAGVLVAIGTFTAPASAKPFQQYPERRVRRDRLHHQLRQGAGRAAPRDIECLLLPQTEV